jgi:quercetin dioxygenase-like cupin family protein
MKAGIIAFVLFAVAMAWAVRVGSGEEKKDDMGLSIHVPADLEWQDGPSSLPPGAKFVLLEGDPAKEGLFVMRVKFPDGYRIPPHTHPKQERVTVLSGTIHVGMGEKFDVSKGKEMPAGSFGSWPPGMKHFVWTKGETIIQAHAEGPWRVDYVNPADDPRKKE